MAATVRSSAVAQTNTATATISVPLPTGWQVGDVCYIAVMITVAGPSITTPAGWTAVVTAFSPSGSASALFAVYRRVLQGGDTDPVVISSTSARRSALSVAIQGADTTTPEDVTPTTDVNTSVAYPDVRAPSITTVTAGCLLLTFNATRNGGTSSTMSFAPPAGMAEVTESENTSQLAATSGIELNQLTLGAAGATGTNTATVTFTSGTSSSPAGVSVAVRPAAGAAAVIPDLVMARYGR